MPRRSKKQPEPTENALPEIPNTGHNPTAQRWLWILVSLFTCIIAGMWIWATKISLAGFSWNKSSEKKIIETGKQNWQTLFNNETDIIKTEKLKAELKTIIEKMAAETATTTTNTPVIATSTIHTTTTN